MTGNNWSTRHPKANKKSLIRPTAFVLISLVTASLAALVLTIITVVIAFNKLEDHAHASKVTALASMDGAGMLLKNSGLHDACSFLKHQLGAGNFMSYSIFALDSEQTCDESKTHPGVPNMQRSRLGNDLIYSLDTEEELTHYYGNYAVTVGYLKASSSSVKAVLEASWQGLLLEFLVLLGLQPLATYLYVSGDMSARQALALGQKSKQTFLTKIFGYTKEMQIAERAADAHKQVVKELQGEAAFAARDFSRKLAAIVQAKNLTMPTSLKGSFVRFDLNGYTEFFSKSQKVAVAGLVDNFAADLHELANRYGGSHYFFAGDEFVEFFDGEDSEARGLFFMRSFFEATEKLHFENAEIPNKFKASLASEDEILFGKNNLFSYLISTALVQGVRYFTAIGSDDKNHNTLLVGKKERALLSGLAKFSDPSLHQLKGLKDPAEISRLIQVIPLKETLRQKHFENLIYYRSDQDIVEFLTTFAETKEADVRKEIAKALRGFESHPVNRCGQELVSAWIHCLDQLDQNWERDQELQAQIINIGKGIIPKPQRDLKLCRELVKLRGITADRTHANAIEFFNNPAIHAEILEKKDPRLVTTRARGNHLISQALLHISPEIMKTLKKMLVSKNENEVATGIFAVSTIVLHYRKNSPDLLASLLEFDQFIQMISELTESKSDLVRNRAQIEISHLNSNQEPLHFT